MLIALHPDSCGVAPAARLRPRLPAAL